MLTKKINEIIKIRYTYNYLSNLRAKNLEYNNSSQKQSICKLGCQKTVCVLSNPGNMELRSEGGVFCLLHGAASVSDKN